MISHKDRQRLNALSERGRRKKKRTAQIRNEHLPKPRKRFPKVHKCTNQFDNKTADTQYIPLKDASRTLSAAVKPQLFETRGRQETGILFRLVKRTFITYPTSGESRTIRSLLHGYTGLLSTS